MSNSDFSSMLRGISPNSSLHELRIIANKLELLAEDNSNEDDTEETEDEDESSDSSIEKGKETNEVIDPKGLALSLRSEVESLTNDLNQLSKLLSLYQAYNDQQLNNIKAALEAAISDYKSAYMATNEYDVNWFSRALLSIPAKMELASFMLSLILKYCKSNTDTLERIANADSEILDLISFPVNEDDAQD